VAPAPPIDVVFPDGSGYLGTSANCDGTWDAPTAPAGYVCVYPFGSEGIDTSNTFGSQSLIDHGFVISVAPADTAGTDMWINGTWAYQAP
jgi:hypothetical protein